MIEIIKSTREIAPLIAQLWALLVLTVWVGTKFTRFNFLAEAIIRYSLLLVLTLAFLLYMKIVFH